MSRRRFIRNIAAVALLATAAFVLACNLWVVWSAQSRVISDPAQLPTQEAALVLGTSAYTWDGDASPDFKGRIAAAAELHRLGKVQRLIASGANPDARYNEPRKMKKALLDAGVPDAAITLDLSGDRTLESVIRAYGEFGFTRFTIVTQEYHAYRAVFLAQQRGLDAWAYCAPGRSLPPREVFARVKAALEVLILPAPEPVKSFPNNPRAPGLPKESAGE
ncbi:MAG: ElyC/SanA/YdcF family protein [Pseudomonadota bacterium]